MGDLDGSLRLDLPKGSAELRGEPVVVLSAHAVETLLRAAPAGSRVDLGRDVGTTMGRRVSQKLGGSSGVRGASLETVVSELAAEIALAGLGELELERWGRAMIIGLSGGPLAQQAEMLAGLIGGAVSAATSADAAAVSVGEGRYFVGSPRACERLRSLITHGTAWSEAIARMQRGGA